MGIAGFQELRVISLHSCIEITNLLLQTFAKSPWRLTRGSSEQPQIKELGIQELLITALYFFQISKFTGSKKNTFCSDNIKMRDAVRGDG
tara:strand:- start:37 stop:306 length:270 start_codon:yes stop_codon:yes gene_type:complete